MVAETPRASALATWKRRGEVWRRATEDVLLELNARTLLRAPEVRARAEARDPRLTVHLLISGRDRKGVRVG
jgi:hypothetical protein